MKLDLAKFDLNLLVAFETLITERGVTRAGRAMGITQAAMSNTLRRLRDIFDDPLFVKSGNRMEPTARALELAGPVEKALEHVRQALGQGRFNAQEADHLFRIGMVDYASSLLLPPLLERFAEIAPRVVIELVDTGGADESVILENGVADLVVSRFQWVPNAIVLHRFCEMEYVCVFRKDYPLEGDYLSLEEFLAARHVHFYPRGMDSTVVDEALQQLGHSKRNIIARTFTLALIPHMLAKSDMMAVIPSGTAKYVAQGLDLRIEPLPFETPSLRMAMAWHPRTDRSPPNIWLREQVKEIMETYGERC